MDKVLLEISGLKTEFVVEKKSFAAVNDVSFKIKQGEILGVVGESGSGKSLTSLSIMQLLPRNGKISKGRILFEGRNLLNLKKRDMCAIRGKQISMIFQDPMIALDPVYRCGEQIAETIRFHEKISQQEAFNRSIELLNQVGIPHPKSYINAYPHQLSGGMCQRIMIAIALSCKPKLLIADEPTTALDVTVQAQILELLKKLRDETHMSIMFITHDLGVIADIADHVAVMYAGEIMEAGNVKTIFKNPSHPYTRGLMMSVPRLNEEKDSVLYSINGTVPSIYAMPEGCRFRTRCPYADETCIIHPTRKKIGENHWISCNKAEGEEVMMNE
jgi:oligopeptide/dipeptide ABC transporter ATP-binding protein